MITTEVNGAALAIAAEFVVGFEASAKIGALYKLIDKAMFDGYELGKLDVEKVSDKWLDDAFDNGYEHGHMIGFKEGFQNVEANSYDEGYLDGVGDARARPELADDTVCEIINEMTQYALNGEFEQECSDDFEDAVDDGAAKHNAHIEGEDYSRTFDPFRGKY